VSTERPPVPLPPILDTSAAERLPLALRKYRVPADLAAYLIVEGLRRAGFLTGRPVSTDRSPQPTQ
jgi:hypothetical protein